MPPRHRPPAGCRFPVRPSISIPRVLGAILAAGSLLLPAHAPAATTPPDAWLPAGWTHPASAAIDRDDALYQRLAGRSSGRRLEIRWEPEPGPEVDHATAWVSTDPLDERVVRDWRTVPMERESGAWTARIALPTIDAPSLYFVQAGRNGRVTASPARAFHPRPAGWDAPTYPFSGYLEGFEDGADAWELVAGGKSGDLSVSAQALSGRAALRVQVPSGRGSVTIGSARLRGWMIEEHRPLAVRLAVRTEFASGRVHLSLHSRARTPDLAVHPAAWGVMVDDRWRRVEVPLGDFASLRAPQVDWLTIQFFADSGTALLLDDVELVMR
ncbi:MAG: hypothetical protein KF833_07105 [Verrucomicrobiae bacterium]|nr:hypothetical protein [Verrucomicrobiae bacterium]